MTLLVHLFVFFLILTVVVIVHEFGHLFAAKLFGIKVEEFGFGLPPRLKKLFKKGETEYTLNWLPIGGFVRLYGENGEQDLDVPDERAFWAKPVWQRAVVLLAGVTMNFLLGALLFAVVYSMLGQVPVKLHAVKIVDVVADSPAAIAKLPIDGLISKMVIDGKPYVIDTTDQFSSLTRTNLGKEITINIQKDGKTEDVKVKLRDSLKSDEGALGVVITDTDLKAFPWWQMPFRGMYAGWEEAVDWGKMVLQGMGMLVSNLIGGKSVAADVTGPVGIFKITSEASNAGMLPTIRLIAILSVNLAIFNVLPLPALDGGRLVFLAIELVRGRRVKDQIEQWVNSAGMIVLLTLMLLITLKDLNQFGVFSKILGIFKR